MKALQVVPDQPAITPELLRQTAYMVQEFSRPNGEGGQPCTLMATAWTLAIIEKCLELMEAGNTGFTDV